MNAAAAPLLSDEADSIADDLHDLGNPDLTDALNALTRFFAKAAADRQRTADALLVAAGDGPNLIKFLAAAVAHLGDPYTNQAVAGLPIGPSRTVHANTEQFAAFLTAWTPTDHITEAANAIHEA